MFLPLSVCVKSSEVLVSLVSCTINTESVLNLRRTKTDRVSRCLSHLCHVRLVYMSVVLFSVPYLQTLLPFIGNTWINYLANGYGSVIACTMVDGKPAVLAL